MISCIEGTVKFQSDQNVYIMTSNGIVTEFIIPLKSFRREILYLFIPIKFLEKTHKSYLVSIQ